MFLKMNYTKVKKDNYLGVRKLRSEFSSQTFKSLRHFFEGNFIKVISILLYSVFLMIILIVNTTTTIEPDKKLMLTISSSWLDGQKTLTSN